MKLGKETALEAYKILSEVEDLLDCILHETKCNSPDNGCLTEDNWNPDYHLDLTICVKEARDADRLHKKIEKFCKANLIPVDLHKKGR